jgi:hypothetical protein
MRAIDSIGDNLTNVRKNGIHSGNVVQMSMSFSAGQSQSNLPRRLSLQPSQGCHGLLAPARAVQHRYVNHAPIASWPKGG